MAIIAMDEETVFTHFNTHYSFEGKKVLEIGGSIPEKYVQNAQEWVSIDPRNTNFVSNNYYYIQGYAQSVNYPDNYFDYIFSCNSFHHISRFDEALSELYRVLKTDGIVFSIFGPIWSAPDGCHIEHVPYQKGFINFWEEQLVPDWYHLVYNFKELYTILSANMENKKAYAIAEYIFFSNWINRMSIFEYYECIKNSKFLVVEFAGSSDWGYDHYNISYRNNLFDKFATWKQKTFSKFPEQYCIRDLNLVLKKI